MTRQECEKAIMKKAREMVDILHQYAPEGNHLSLAYINEDGDGYISIHNCYWNEDKENPIDCSETNEDINKEEDNE